MGSICISTAPLEITAVIPHLSDMAVALQATEVAASFLADLQAQSLTLATLLPSPIESPAPSPPWPHSCLKPLLQVVGCVSVLGSHLA